jgi:hypothetical protein
MNAASTRAPVRVRGSWRQFVNDNAAVRLRRVLEGVLVGDDRLEGIVPRIDRIS